MVQYLRYIGYKRCFAVKGGDATLRRLKLTYCSSSTVPKAFSQATPLMEQLLAGLEPRQPQVCADPAAQ